MSPPEWWRNGQALEYVGPDGRRGWLIVGLHRTRTGLSHVELLGADSKSLHMPLATFWRRWKPIGWNADAATECEGLVRSAIEIALREIGVPGIEFALRRRVKYDGVQELVCECVKPARFGAAQDFVRGIEAPRAAVDMLHGLANLARECGGGYLAHALAKQAQAIVERGRAY